MSEFEDQRMSDEWADIVEFLGGIYDEEFDPYEDELGMIGGE